MVGVLVFVVPVLAHVASSWVRELNKLSCSGASQTIRLAV